MEEICGEECWALPAHVNRKEADWRITVDLFACETAQTLALLSDRLAGQLPEALKRLILDNIRRRVLNPFFSAPVPYGIWEGAGHNWNAVCAGSIGSVCLHLMREERQRLEACLDRICESLISYVDGFAEDGACMEGLGYYTYGMTYFVNFARELYIYTDGQRDLLCGKWGRFEESRRDKRFSMAQFPAKCFFGDGGSISFSDGSSRETFRVGLCCALAAAFGTGEGIFPGMIPEDVGYSHATGAPDAAGLLSAAGLPNATGLHGDPCYRFAALRMDLEETAQYLERTAGDHGNAVQRPVGERQPAKGCRCGSAGRSGGSGWSGGSSFHVLPSAQWCIGNAASGVGFACKGGHNGETHNHNDIGHFIYEAGGVMLFTDLGAGEYTKEYFGAGRYDILCNRSLGHSVPVIAGEEQRAGREYCCSGFRADEDGSVEMELARAYPGGLLERFERTFQFDLVTGRLLVRDSIWFPGERGGVQSGFGVKETKEQPKAQEVVENLVTQIRPAIAREGIVLEAGKIRAVLSIDGADPSGVIIREYDHSNHQGFNEKVYALQWHVPVALGRADCAFHIWIEKESMFQSISKKEKTR
ncbi:MAG: hypothetical protein HDR26_04675 [Lachnospiraceae bacterium]|nr:hypothetical protein [Lachnospiraceae bacterium]